MGLEREIDFCIYTVMNRGILSGGRRGRRGGGGGGRILSLTGYVTLVF